MALSMYEASVPLFLRGLDQLTHVLGKGAAHAQSGGVDPATLVQARLAPDMFTLAGQVQRASDTAKASIARLSGVAAPAMADDEASFDDLLQRCAKTRAYIAGVAPDAFKGSGERVIEMKMPGRAVTFNGQAYLLQFGIPNFFFHLTTAYDILRQQGVPLSKLDYIGPLG